MNHPSAGDHMRMAGTIFGGPTANGSEAGIAIAHHQIFAGIPWAMGKLGVETHGVVTKSTKAKGKNKLHPTQKMRLYAEYASSVLPWNQRSEQQQKAIKNRMEERNALPVGHGAKDYARSVGRMLAAGGKVAVLGPQGTRSHLLKPWDMPGENGEKPERPVALLLAAVPKQERDKIGFVFVGIDPNTEGAGHNPGVRYDMKIGQFIMHDELTQHASENGISIDNAVYEMLNEVVPERFRITNSE